MDIIVYLNQAGTFIPVGRMLFEELGRESRSSFAYGLKYLLKPKSIAIDPIELPLVEKEFHTSSEFSIFNVIRDAGPDNWGRYLLSKRFGRDLNELEYVLGVGPNRVGALAFGPDLSGPQILGPSGFEEYESKDLEIDFCIQAAEDIIANEDSERLKEYLRYGSSLGGARPKASVVFNEEKYLAKFSVSLDTRNEPLIEYSAMTLARECGLNVPEIKTIKVMKRDVFLIKRFDRIKSKDLELKIPFISGLTASQLHETDYLSWSYLHLCQAITKFSPTPKIDKLELFKRIVFNVLINNDDDHMRNHGFLYTSKNNWALSPLYDVVPRNQKTETFRSAMNIGNFGKEASQRNVLSASSYFDLEPDQANAIWHDLESQVLTKWKDIFSSSGLSRKEVEMFEHSIRTK